MSEYNKEQIQTLHVIRQFLAEKSPGEIELYRKDITQYSLFREKISKFSRENFATICKKKCFDNGLSACCTKEGIITYFADVFINVIYSDDDQIDQMIKALEDRNQSSSDCVYLGPNGCIWNIKPIVCEMFFCDSLIEDAQKNNPAIKKELAVLKMLQKNFTWPDKPVYFNTIEKIFIEKGHHSPLMYMHNSPGLMNIKKKAGLL